MIKVLTRKYKNVCVESIIAYLSLIEACQKRKYLERGIVSKPIILREMNSSCEVDPIDMQSNPEHDMKSISVYRDHLTKFVLFRS